VGVNGKNHAILGVASFAGAVYIGTRHLGLADPSAGQMVAGTVVAIGASLSPDADEGHSTASRGLGPIGTVVRLFAGGHRGRTHSPLIAVGMFGLCWLAMQGWGNGWLFAGLCAFMVAAGAPFISNTLIDKKVGWPISITAGLITLAGIRYFDIQPDWWLYAAIPVPYLLHMVGDTPTPAGVPWFHPLSKRKFGFGLFKSGGKFEQIVVTPLLLVSATALMIAVIAGV
jgi:membrane-bound metal-dependent hydrolase YbcI (DUF457 family)